MPTPLTSLLQSKFSSCSTRVRIWDKPESKKQKIATHFSTNRSSKANQWPRPPKSNLPQFILPRNIYWFSVCSTCSLQSTLLHKRFFSIMLFIRVRSIPTILKLPVRKNTWRIPYVSEVWVQTQISYWEEAGIKNCLVHFIGFSFRWPTVQARDHIFLHVWEVQTFWRTSLIKYVIPLNIYCCQTLRALPRKREELFFLFKSSTWSVRNSILVQWGGWEDSILLKSQGTEGKRWQIDQILYKIRSRYRTDFSECMEFTLTSAISLTRSFTFFFLKIKKQY